MNASTPILFLHGLAGSGAEWSAIQSVVPGETPDLRTTGTRDEYVSDVVEIIDSRRMVLIGQSLGGHTAFLVAAKRPDLVDGLVVIEAGPDRDADAPKRMRALLHEDPAPYGVDLDPDDAARSLEEIAARDWWEMWRRIRCPVLVVRGDAGFLAADVAARMANTVASGRVAKIEGAGHDVHLDEPIVLGEAIRSWLASLQGHD